MNKPAKFLIVLSSLLSLAMTTSCATNSSLNTLQEAPAKSKPVVWQCASDLEVSCFNGKCESASEGFTPIRITATYQEEQTGALSVCAYSGCWEDKVTIHGQKPFIVLLGSDMPFSSSPNDASLKENVVLSIDESDGIGVVKVGTFAQPVLCKKMFNPTTTKRDSSGADNNESNQEVAPMMKTVAIKGGCFQMGGPSQETERDRDDRQKEVCVTDFSIGAHEVTQKQWVALMGSNPSYVKGDFLPVERVSLHDVNIFISKLNQKTGHRYRLPTSAEWEYAARAGTTTEFYTGDCISPDQANFDGRKSYANCDIITDVTPETTLPAESFEPNAFGLYDMAGNVWEWTCSEDYWQFENRCIENMNDDDKIIIQGGSWWNSAYSLRSTHRSWRNPDHFRNDLGFRLVMSK